jgi:hypothetical protein
MGLLDAHNSKENKYGNTKCEYKGLYFDSIGERSRWIWLENEFKGGRIASLSRQVSFDMTINNCPVCVYIADFAYTVYCKVKDGPILIVEDFKGGYKLPADFGIKRKLLWALHGIDLQIIKSPTAKVGLQNDANKN